MRISLFTLILALLACFVAFHPNVVMTYSPLLTLNSDYQNKLPRMFHTTPMKTSGSSQFSASSLKAMIKAIPSDNIHIVDTREEPHGFLNDNAISWYVDRNWINEGKTKKEIIENEAALLRTLSKKKFTFVYKDRAYPLPTLVRSTKTEEKLAKKLNIGYTRLPVRDHVRPSDEMVDEFIALVKSLPKDTWYHFHCSAGKGRTTTFLSMYDMMLHAQEASFEEIIARQASWGGANLLSLPEAEEWKYSCIVERAKFVEKFHEYCKANPDFRVKWSEWVKLS